MADPIAPTGSISDELVGKTVDLETLSSASQVEETQSSNFSKLTENLQNLVLKDISVSKPVDEARVGLVGGAGSEVNSQKESFVSEVTRPGTEVNAETSDEDAFNTVVERTKHIYGEITVHHIAWGIAQRMQKDMSQLLRGS